MRIKSGLAVLVGAAGAYWALRQARQTQQLHRERKRTDDLIDQAARDSFPSSDPPSFAGNR